MSSVNQSLQAQLLTILRTQALLKLDKPVQLASGKWSYDFIDVKKALTAWKDLRIASEAIFEAVTAAANMTDMATATNMVAVTNMNRGSNFNPVGNFEAVGGPSTGANALAVGIASVSDSRWFFVRKEPKNRGTERVIEGAQIKLGDKVLLIDDVVTTGGSILKAYDVLKRAGAEIVAAVTLVDRGVHASQKFQQLNIRYLPMTTYKSLNIDPV